MPITITGDRLHQDGVPVPFVPAKYYGGRFVPELIVLHDTADINRGGAVRWFANPDRQVSAHVVVERDGSITQMVPFDHKAWHCDPATWQGRPHVNHFSIGIEMVSPGKLTQLPGGEYHAWFGTIHSRQCGNSQVIRCKTQEHGDGWWLEYTPEQVEAVINLCRAIISTYPIKDITTHWHIAPGRKIDPAPIFPLVEVKAKAFAAQRSAPGRLAANDTQEMSLGAEGADVLAAQQALAAKGYTMVGAADGRFGPATRAAVLAFQAENGLDLDGSLSRDEWVVLVESGAAKPMPRGTREVAEANDVPEVQFPATVKRVGQVVGGALVGDTTIEQTTGVSPVSAGLSYLDTATQATSKLASLGVHVSARTGLTVLGLIIACGLAAWGSKHLSRTLRRFRSGHIQPGA